MTEKADLLDQLQHYEHVNIQLENETETIGKWLWLLYGRLISRGENFEVFANFTLSLKF